jgi:hypothetical protein
MTLERTGGTMTTFLCDACVLILTYEDFFLFGLVWFGLGRAEFNQSNISRIDAATVKEKHDE